MATTDVAGPDECEDGKLSPEFMIFTCPDFDQNEDKAREAGDELGSILRDIIYRVCDLEDIARALREAEPTSTRAQCARRQLLRALSQTDSLIIGVGNARDAFTVRRNTTTTSVSR